MYGAFLVLALRGSEGDLAWRPLRGTERQLLMRRKRVAGLEAATPRRQPSLRK